ncbi:MAG: histidine phosphatase family protein [Planctomycetota bacterium]
MSYQLIIMRHAKSDHGDPSLSDHQRPLNARGRRDAPRMAAWLDDRAMVPDVILASDSQRTMETAERMLKQWTSSSELVACDTLYLASPESMLGTLATEHRDGRRVLLLGHNPGCSILSSHLAGVRLEMPTAAMAVFDVSTSGPEARSPMRDIGASAKCALLSFVTPKSLSEPNF